MFSKKPHYFLLENNIYKICNIILVCQVKFRNFSKLKPKLFNYQTTLPKCLSLKKAIILHIFSFSWQFIIIVYL